MKKILLSLLCVSSLASFAQTQRMVLIEEFTNASCGPCASQNPAFNSLLANNMDKVVQLKYQTVWPGVDPMNAQNQSDVATRVTRYGVNGVPFAVIDGDTNKAAGASYLGAPANVNQSMINTQYAVPSPLTLTMTYNYNSVTDSFTTVVTITNATSSTINASAAGNLKLMVSLTEMNIGFATAPGSNGELDFFYVMRKMIPSVSGTVLPDAINAGQTLTYTLKDKAPSYIYKKAQMCVVGFVQDFGNNVVHQAAYGRPTNVLDVKLENMTTSASTDYCGKTINPSIKITNKTATTVTSGTVGYTINGAGGYSQPWTGSLANGANATVTLPAITAPIGNNIYAFYFNNLNGGAVDIIESDNVLSRTAASVVGTVSGTFNEDFEAPAIGTQYTSISINNALSLPGYVLDKSISGSATDKIGGFALSDKSFRFNCFNIASGNNIGLIFYKNNMSGKNLKAIQFDYAYNNYTEAGTVYNDALAVKASVDCGKTWTELWKKTGTGLVTTSQANTAPFYPKAADWRVDGAALTSTFENATELLIMFEGQSGFGNNLYIDNVNFKTAVGVDDVVKNTNVTIYPNPVNNVLNVSFDLAAASDLQVSMTDVTGKVIYSASLQNITNDTHNINTANIANGVYNLVINNNGKIVNKKVTIAH